MKFRSDRKLAEYLLQQPVQPSELKLENLANNLGKLDRGDAGWWLGVGEPWLPLLADALKEDLDVLRARIYRMGNPSSGEGGRPDRFVQFSWLRALDLETEPLPPGIPYPPNLGPDAPRVWWAAGPGAGKTLLGRWLEIKHGWSRVCVGTWREALALLPTSGRVYVELERPDSEPVRDDGVHPDLQIWVAAPFGPTPPRPARSDWAGQEESPQEAPVWTEILTAPVRDWIDELLDWVAARAQPGGRFDREEVVALLKDLPWMDMFVTPGDLVEFLGLVDEVGASALQEGAGFDTDALIRRWLFQAIGRPDRPVPPSHATLLRHDGARLLLELVQERLRAGLPPALTPEEWAALVPRRRAPPLDRDALLSLIEQGTPASKAEAKAMLKPSKEDVIAALQGVQALVREEGESWSLRPRWLANLAHKAAVEALIEEGPEGLGALLLYPQSASEALLALLGQVCRGDLALVRACVTEVDGRSPEGLAALDGAFRILGHRLLLGDVIPEELLAQAWDVQMAYVAMLYLNFPPLPIVRVGSMESLGLTGQGTWLRAALAVSMALRATNPSLAMGPLNPWGGIPSEEPARAVCLQALNYALFDTYVHSEKTPLREDLAWACARLAVALLDRLGPQPQVHNLMQAAAPTLLVRLARDGNSVFPEGPLRDAMRLPGGLGPIERACEAEQVPLDLVIGWLWRFWSLSGPEGRQAWPPFAWTSRDRVDPAQQTQAERLWRVLPDDAIGDSVLQHIGHRSEVWPWLQASFWPTWVRALTERGHTLHVTEALWDHIPLPHLLDLIRATPHPIHRINAFNAAWRRAPDEALQLLDQLAAEPERPLQGNSTVALELMAAGLEHLPEALLDRAERWAGIPGACPGVGPYLEVWLMRAVERRVPGWRRAFVLLTDGRRPSPGDEDRLPKPRSRA